MHHHAPGTDLYWVRHIAPHRLALAPYPRADRLDDELGAWHVAGVDTVVSLLPDDEARALGLRAERALCSRHGMQFLSFPLADGATPASAPALLALLEPLRDRLRQGGGVAIHCRAGIGRTGLVAGCLLHLLGVPADDIFPRLSRSRGLPVPDTREQAEWVRRFCRDTPAASPDAVLTAAPTTAPGAMPPTPTQTPLPATGAAASASAPASSQRRRVGVSHLIDIRFNEQPVAAPTPDALDQALAGFRQVESFELWLAVPHGASLCMLRSGEHAWLMYLREPGDSGYHSVDDAARKGSVRFRLANGQFDDYPLAWCVDLERCFGAVREFYDSGGGWPLSVRWKD